MSVVVYRDGVIAADRSVGFRGRRFGTGTRLHRIKPHNSATEILFGFTGAYTNLQALRRWLEGHHDYARFTEDLEVIAIAANDVRYARAPFLEFAPFAAPFLAIGEGAAPAVAHGALLMGASAEQAVTLAIEACPDCGGGVDVMNYSASADSFRPAPTVSAPYDDLVIGTPPYPYSTHTGGPR